MTGESNAAVQTLEQDLDAAMSRLALALASDPAADNDFDIDLPRPERELLAVLGSGATAGLSFAAGESEESAASRMLDELIERASTRASVATELDGRVVASTRVGRDGDIVCCVEPELDGEQLSRHAGDVERALREQRERMVMLLSVLEAASKIALAAGTGNPLLAVPTAIRFIRGIMAERKP